MTAFSEHFTEADRAELAQVIARKRRGIDCTSDESVLAIIGHHVLDESDPLHEQIARWLPAEHDQALGQEEDYGGALWPEGGCCELHPASDDASLQRAAQRTLTAAAHSAGDTPASLALGEEE